VFHVTYIDLNEGYLTEELSYKLTHIDFHCAG